MGYLTHQCRLFFIALQFFTRVPIPAWVGFEPAWLHQASRYFPLVGVLVGAVGAAVYAAAAWIWPAPVAALLSTAATVYLTGAFHEDGFADTCDGFGGGLSRERVLEIMKDSRIGSYGAVALVLLLGLKLALLACMPPTTAVAALLFAHPLSRLAASSLILTLDYARENGKAKPMAQQMRAGEFAIAALTALVPAVALAACGWLSASSVAFGVLAAAAVAFWLGAKFQRRVGGYTGDCLGAVQQVSEVAIYLCVLGAAAQGAWR
ncbi:MAG: adenosylcobinamide-GDP ribazoletransferase [Gammaproteobacteria bacterium]